MRNPTRIEFKAEDAQEYIKARERQKRQSPAKDSLFGAAPADGHPQAWLTPAPAVQPASRRAAGATAATLSLEELRTRLKEELGLKVGEDRVRWLMDSRKQGAEALGLEDLRSEAFQAALDRLTVETQEEKRRVMLEERQRELQKQKERKEEQQQQEEAALEPEEVNDDRSFQTRILGSLAYFLPLLDGLQFGFPLARDLPFLAPIFALLSGPLQLVNAVPFGSLLFFIALTVLVNNRSLPRLLRFNLQQAVLLDVALFLPSLLVSLLSMASGDSLGGNMEGLNAVVFTMLTIAIAYSVLLTLFGLDPDGLPVISDASRRGVDRPGP